MACRGCYKIAIRRTWARCIHKVSNRAFRLWKRYNDTVFKNPREKRGAWLQEHHPEVIQRLNADYFKPWFQAKNVTHEERWLGLSLRNLTGD